MLLLQARRVGFDSYKCRPDAVDSTLTVISWRLGRRASLGLVAHGAWRTSVSPEASAHEETGANTLMIGAMRNQPTGVPLCVLRGPSVGRHRYCFVSELGGRDKACCSNGVTWSTQTCYDAQVFFFLHVQCFGVEML